MQKPSTALHPQLALQASTLHALARFLVRGQDAEDFVQDAFVKALAAESEPRKLGPWLRRLLRNDVIDTHRQTRRREELREQIPKEAGPALPEDLTAHRQSIQALHEALERLEEPYREVLQQRFFGGCTTKEIATNFSIAPGTVRWRVHEGLRRIRVDLDTRFGKRSLWCGAFLACWGFSAEAVAMPELPDGSGGQLEETTMNTFVVGTKILGATVATAVVITAGVTTAVVQARETPSAEQTDAAASAGHETKERATSSKYRRAPMLMRGQLGSESSSEDAGVEGQGDPLSGCSDLIAETRANGKFEIALVIEGTANGNRIRHVEANHERASCLNGPQGPHEPVPQGLSAVTGCIEAKFDPAWFGSPLSEGDWSCEARSFAVVPEQGPLERGGFHLRRFERNESSNVATNPELTLPEVTLTAEELKIENATQNPNLPRFGDSDARLQIAVCGTYGDSDSNLARGTVDQLVSDYPGDVSVRWLHHPGNYGQVLFSRAAVAAHNQGKFMDVHPEFSEKQFESREILLVRLEELGLDIERFEADLGSESTGLIVAKQSAVCSNQGVGSRPAFYIGSKRYAGPPIYSQLQEAVEIELKR